MNALKNALLLQVATILLCFLGVIFGILEKRGFSYNHFYISFY